MNDIDMNRTENGY